MRRRRQPASPSSLLLATLAMQNRANAAPPLAPSPYPVVASLLAFLRAGLQPATQIANSAVAAIRLKLMVLVRLLVVTSVTTPQKAVDAAAVARSLGSASP